MQGPAEPPASKVSALAWALVPAVLAIGANAASLWHGFMADDHVLLLGNPQITDGRSFWTLISTDWFDRGTGSIGYWRPLVKLSFRATYLLVGRTPWPYHLTNLVAHALTALLLGLLLRRLVAVPTAAMAASVFAVHPGTVQAVDIITARSDVLAALGLLAALLAFDRWLTHGATRFAVAACGLFVLALGSKECAALVPLLAVFWAVQRGLHWRAAALRSVLFVVPLGLYGAARLALGIHGLPNALAALSWSQRLGGSVVAFWTYQRALWLGTELVLLPRVPSSVFEVPVLVGLLVGLGYAGLIVARRVPRAVSFGALTVLCGLGPVMAVWLLHIPMWHLEVPVAERWLYLPAAGEAFVLAGALSLLGPSARAAIALALVVVLGGVSWGRTPIYRSDDAYSAHVAELYRQAPPQALSPRDRYLLALSDAAEADRSNPQEAPALYRRAVALAPYLPEAIVGLGRASERIGDEQAAGWAAEQLLAPSFRTAPAAVAQRAEFADDALWRTDWAAVWAMLARARHARHDGPGALDAAKRAVAAAKGRLDQAQYERWYAQVAALSDRAAPGAPSP